jgi:hypothetical protein
MSDNQESLSERVERLEELNNVLEEKISEMTEVISGLVQKIDSLAITGGNGPQVQPTNHSVTQNIPAYQPEIHVASSSAVQPVIAPAITKTSEPKKPIPPKTEGYLFVWKCLYEGRDMYYIGWNQEKNFMVSHAKAQAASYPIVYDSKIKKLIYFRPHQYVDCRYILAIYIYRYGIDNARSIVHPKMKTKWFTTVTEVVEFIQKHKEFADKIDKWFTENENGFQILVPGTVEALESLGFFPDRPHILEDIKPDK